MVARKGDPCPLVEDGKVCGKPVTSRGWCGMHYMRWRTHGDPLHPVRRYVKQGEKCAYKDGCDDPPKRYGLCEKHARRLVKHGETTEPRERKFWAKVNKNGPVPPHRRDLGPCWVWEGYIDPNTGYGQFGSKGKGSNLPHRIAYQYLVGPIGEGLHLDHLCRNRRCVNALGHLDPVTPRENIRRGDQGAFWGYVPEPPPLKAPKPVVCTKCGRTDKPVYKAGLCRPCWRKRAKDPNYKRPELPTVEERFWSKVDKTDSCWLWTGAINRGTGYGQFSPKHGFQVQTHRYSYELAKGPIPEKHDVHHTCHVRRCLNPAHLIATTRSENMRLRKNRRDT